ncbi:hypothetical protein SAMN04488238_11637 [Roseicitreum antarcticum]|uniref:Uncharacterized protein n=1 Tax=Roseicitreum antarcticum TaxID=564137 RepID=A0A1H3DX04_9RHOB|nr:hypothetical protein SAMN04488238_11637 [Roseicitreum antarcticum]
MMNGCGMGLGMGFGWLWMIVILVLVRSRNCSAGKIFAQIRTAITLITQNIFDFGTLGTRITL